MTSRTNMNLLLLLIVFYCSESVKVRHHSGGKQGLKYLTHGIGNGYGNGGQPPENVGLWPSVFNVATKALIAVNATCGEGGREEFCRLSDGARGRCGVCDNFSPDPGKRHSIHYAIDGSNRWWQSPTLYNGPEYEYVTITLDLKQVYQVAYVIIKAANSPRPGAWVLEKSFDGENYVPWQFFARYDKECLERYGIPATKGKPHYVTDADVICTSYYSKLSPMENGEIHTSLVHGRPGANETSPELLEFTKARYVRLKFQGFRGSVEPVPRWLSQDISKDKRLFYSIRDVSIGGQCVCNGHAAHCRHNVASGHPECECAHHTCGPNCDRCCPMFNQRQWGPGSSRDARKCLACNCHGHAKSCHYDEAVDRAGLSVDINGNHQGGGVCDNCTAYTTGINCEKCIRGFYRPAGVTPDAEIPCLKCDCDRLGSTESCDPEEPSAGMCHCKPEYTGPKCDRCASGYRGYPNCEVCPCDSRGIVPYNDCENDCVCKVFVEGRNCDHCKTGHFALRDDHPEGCAACYCSGVTTLCESAHLIPRIFETREDWRIADISISKVVEPTWNPEANTWLIGNYEIPDVESFYWLAPKDYLGNKLESYGSHLTFKVHWIVMRGDTSGKPTAGPNIVLVGSNGIKIAYGDEEYTGSNTTFKIKLQEYGWYHVPAGVKDIVTRLRRNEYKGDPVSRFQYLSVLTDIKYVMLRATFHTDQIEGMLEGATLESGQLGEDENYSPVEKCSCPSGYTGLSCESCDYGYVRLITNTSAHQEQGFCVKCDCNGHSETCNPDTGQCFCEHKTIGEKCERCAHGYYGNPLAGTPYDCKKCACPLLEEENNFSPSCQLDFFSETDGEMGGYVCTQCPKGYTGDHCELCDDGYFGDPTELSNRCEPCSCGGGRCDRMTGQCLGCPGNTEGWRCEKCKRSYFGDPLNANCQACLCDPFGSIFPDCDNVTGQCLCKDHFVGRTCEECEVGYGNVTASCTLCTCHEIGSKSEICDTHTGICDCKPGVEGFRCDACQHLHYGFSEAGCQKDNSDSSTLDEEHKITDLLNMDVWDSPIRQTEDFVNDSSIEVTKKIAKIAHDSNTNNLNEVPSASTYVVSGTNLACSSIIEEPSSPEASNNFNSDSDGDFSSTDSINDPSFHPISDTDNDSENPSANEDLQPEYEPAVGERSVAAVEAPAIRKKTRKRVREEAKWAKNIRKEKRASGQEYTGRGGKVVHERSIRGVCNCKLKCKSAVTEEERNLVHGKFWRAISWDQRKQFIALSVKHTEIERTRPRNNKQQVVESTPISTGYE